MLILNNTDVIEGGASVDAVVEYTISGFVSGTTPINLATGVLSTTLTTVLVTAGAVTCIVGITATNTHSAAVNVTLRLDPTNSGAPRYIIPKTISLGIGYSLFTDGVKFSVYDATGAELYALSLADIAHGGTGLTTITDHTLVVGSGVAALTELGVATHGQLPIGSTGADPVLVALTEGEGIDITNAAGSITVAAELSTATNPGVVELATVAEAVTGTDTSRATTAEGVHAAIAVDKNPKAFAQGVHMTAAASGSSGIQVADDDDIDFGTGDFTLVWRGSLPDWTPSENVIIFRKLSISANDYRGYLLQYRTTGYLFLRLYINELFIDATSTVTLSSIGIVDGTDVEIAVSITRETGSTAGSIVFHVNRLPLGSAVAITAATPVSINSTTSLHILGSDAIRYASTSHFVATINRALTAAQVLDLYRNGIDFADKYGSQTGLITGTDSDMSGANNWANNTAAVFDVNSTVAGKLYWKEGGGDDNGLLASAYNFMVAGKRYRISLKARLNAGVTHEIYIGRGASAAIAALGNCFAFTPTGTETTFSGEFLANNSGNLVIGTSNSGVADVAFEADDICLYEIGATLALEGEGIQPAPGQWLDSSSNKLHAMQPATGSSLIRLKKEFEFRWTNTWTASAAAQYIGGLNQVVLTTKHFITSIVSRATVVTDLENIEIGDGAAAAYYVAAVVPTAAPIIHTLAKNLNDGTNLKLVITPAAEATMTVEFIVKGYLLE